MSGVELFLPYDLIHASWFYIEYYLRNHDIVNSGPFLLKIIHVLYNHIKCIYNDRRECRCNKFRLYKNNYRGKKNLEVEEYISVISLLLFITV